MSERQRSKWGRRASLGVLALGCWVALAGVTLAEDDASDLAKTVQNPLASLVSLPFQANFNTDTGPFDRDAFNLNMQPVVPFTGEKWNVIARAIIPFNSVPQGATDSVFGLGDTNLSLFWSPNKSGNLTWGVGPIFGLPTASNQEVLGSQQWSLGVTGVIFYQTGNWTMGGVASNQWSVAGPDDRADVNLFAAQYFVNYNFGKGWALGTAPSLSANWEASSGEEWTIPWGLQVSKLTHFGSRPVSLLLGYYENSDHPVNGPEGQIRFQINFLFPSKAH